ncbi:Membrane protein involved in the export of O-antigen and teichoic acid [Klenkia brasiliensis]|uniref:Membrane protein involved in the export of O-antigen and teichoic acid n=1 Tax=Klenkia brasiliensis TaxID=333142 RepID=A0A1G7MS23_9ACTN|nr:Membrane protein involved in the export of O-antigen and teichoic acid [Klenkia brasiliensis]
MAPLKSLGSKTGGSRLSLGMVDAGVSSLGNLLTSLVVAHYVSLPVFGQFSVGLLVAVTLQAATRSWFGDTLILSYGESSRPRTSEFLSNALPSLTALGTTCWPIAAAAAAVATLLMQVSFVWWEWSLLAVALAAVVLQDHVRWTCYAERRMGAALLISTCWSINAAFWVWLSCSAGLRSSTLVVAIWGLSSVPGGLIGLGLLLRGRGWRGAEFRAGSRWIVGNFGRSVRLVSDFLLTQASGQIAILLLSVLVSLDSLGLVRKVQILMGPAMVVISGLLAALQPLLAERIRKFGRYDLSALRFASAVAAAGSVAFASYGLLLWFLPSPWISTLVGGDWRDAREYLPPLIVQLIASLVGGCFGVLLRANRQIGVQIKVRALLALPILGSVAAFCIWMAASGGLWVIACSSTVTAVIWIAVFLAGRRSWLQQMHRDTANH